MQYNKGAIQQKNGFALLHMLITSIKQYTHVPKM